VESVRGQLLIAGPTLADPNFWRTVVLIVEHNDEGALGLILNRPSETTVGDGLPQLAGLVDPDEEVHLGGPVAPSAVMVLAEFTDPVEAALLAFDSVGIVGTGGPAGTGTGAGGTGGSGGTGESTPDVTAARAFAGHAGWGPGQLDAELERDDWILEPARRSDAFTEDPASLWASVLARKGGSYALIARMPADPSQN
jgi:putative transcriptional regulator